MYQDVLEKNRDYLKKQKSYRNYDVLLAQVVQELNKNKILTISGLRHCGKTKLAYELLKSTKSFQDCFYYNSDLDSLGAIKTHEDMITLLDIHVRVYGIPKIIILQNTNNILGIKKLISQIFKTKKYKIVIIGNNIKISGVKDIEVFPLGISKKHYENRNYGGIPEVQIIPDTHYKDFLIESLKNDIICRDILEVYNIKNISLFYKVLSFIALFKGYLSQRELHRKLKEHSIDISLLTLIDYLNASLNTKFLSRCYKHDIKNNNTISSSAQYYFGDSGIRSSFTKDGTDFLENTLYLELKQRGYYVYGGINGRFSYSFHAKKGESTIDLHLEESSDKNDLRKSARKLAKLGNNSQKYLIVKDTQGLGMRKFEEQGIPIITFLEFLQKI